MEPGNPVAGGQHGARHAVGPVLGAREDEGPAVLLAEQPQEERRLLQPVGRVEHLRHLGDGLGDGADLDADRPDEVPAHEPIDLGRHRRREAECLPVERGHAQDALDLRREAHVEHAVGLVEDDDADRAEGCRAALEVIEEAPRRRDDHVGTPLQPRELGPHGLTADEDDGCETARAAERVERLGDLERELARGREHQRARPGADARGRARARPREPFDRRDGERRRLAGAGLRAADQVATLEDRPDGLRLDRRGNRKARARDGVAHGGRERKIGE